MVEHNGCFNVDYFALIPTTSITLLRFKPCATAPIRYTPAATADTISQSTVAIPPSVV